MMMDIEPGQPQGIAPTRWITTVVAVHPCPVQQPAMMTVIETGQPQGIAPTWRIITVVAGFTPVQFSNRNDDGHRIRATARDCPYAI